MGYKILIVDDEKMIRMGIRNAMPWEQMQIAEVYTASCAREAAELIREHRPEIMITDISMTEMSGLELVEQIRKEKNEMRIIVLTGYDRFDYARQALQLQVHDFLLKPIDEAELQKSILTQVEWLENCRIRQADRITASRAQGVRQQTELEELFKIEQYAEMALYFARLDSLSSDLLFRSCNVREIVKQAVKKYSVLFLRSGLSFRMEEFDIKAVTDEKWLSFVVEQVFSNALKYTHEGGIAIYGADAEGSMIQGNAYYLVIEDTGIGIRESDLPRIFERGFTGYNGRMDKKSTGIGLYLCEQIMRRMSHTIRVESAPGKGTKVILGFWQEQ